MTLINALTTQKCHDMILPRKPPQLDKRQRPYPIMWQDKRREENHPQRTQYRARHLHNNSLVRPHPHHHPRTQEHQPQHGNITTGLERKAEPPLLDMPTLRSSRGRTQTRRSIALFPFKGHCSLFGNVRIEDGLDAPLLVFRLAFRNGTRRPVVNVIGFFGHRHLVPSPRGGTQRGPADVGKEPRKEHGIDDLGRKVGLIVRDGDDLRLHARDKGTLVVKYCKCN